MEDIKSVVSSGGSSMKVLGIIAIILGILALLAPGLTGLSVVLLLGFLVLAGGIVRTIGAFKAGSVGKGLLKLVLGALTILCGIMLIANPLFTSGVITIMLAIYLILDGGIEIFAAFDLRPVEGWGWMLFGGIVSILLGIMIWGRFPFSGALAMGIIIGIKLFFIGLVMITGGSALKSITKNT